MERISCTPRENYREIVEKQGFGFHESYWMEDACYCFTSAEIEALEKATAECYEMYCKAVEACLYDNRRLDALCIPAAVREAIVRSWEEDDYSLYGRFDFAFVNGVPKLLEFNADTPTSLVEAAVIQWLWKEDVFPSHDQFNSIHEKWWNPGNISTNDINAAGITLHQFPIVWKTMPLWAISFQRPLRRGLFLTKWIFAA